MAPGFDEEAARRLATPVGPPDRRAAADPLAGSGDHRPARGSAHRTAQARPPFQRARAASLLGPERPAADRRHRGRIRAMASTSTAPPTASSRSAPGGTDPRPLRQGAPRPLWRISADAAAAVRDRPVAARARRPRLHPGPGPRTIDLAASRARSASSSATRSSSRARSSTARNRPDFIFNPSNDAWFGCWGPPQHLAQARLRAAEEGLPIIRATPTGITAVIDAHGNVVKSLPLAQGGRDRRGPSAGRRAADPVRPLRQCHPAAARLRC